MNLEQERSIPKETIHILVFLSASEGLTTAGIADVPVPPWVMTGWPSGPEPNIPVNKKYAGVVVVVVVVVAELGYRPRDPVLDF